MKYLFRLSHHHFTKFIKVHRSRTVLIKFFKNSLKFFLSERSQKFTNKASKSFSCDVAKTFLVIYPEGILQFSLHGLHVWVLNQEGGAELTELSKLNLSGTIL